VEFLTTGVGFFKLSADGDPRAPVLSSSSFRPSRPLGRSNLGLLGPDRAPCCSLQVAFPGAPVAAAYSCGFFFFFCSCPSQPLSLRTHVRAPGVLARLYGVFPSISS